MKSEAASCSAGQETTLNQTIPFHTLISYVLMIQFNIIVPSSHTYPKCVFPMGYKTKIFHHIERYMSAHHILLDFI
jgi:hypothetical protein